MGNAEYMGSYSVTSDSEGNFLHSQDG